MFDPWEGTADPLESPHGGNTNPWKPSLVVDASFVFTEADSVPERSETFVMREGSGA